MNRLLLTLSYDGTGYHGWQVQPGKRTVQSALQDAVERVTGVRSGITGCSRTDAGVHARMFCCTFDTNVSLSGERMVAALNANLPEDIVVTRCRTVPPTFHPRYQSLGKLYQYVLDNGRVPDPFSRAYAVHYRRPLNADSMAKTASLFEGTHEFSAFCAAGSAVTDKVRCVRRATVTRSGDRLIFSVEADGFLYNMVRIMVGTLLDVESGRLTRADITEALRTGNRQLTGFTAPAKGLCLEQVFYDEEVLTWPKKTI